MLTPIPTILSAILLLRLTAIRDTFRSRRFLFISRCSFLCGDLVNSSQNTSAGIIEQTIGETRRRLLSHPVYASVDRIEHLQIFMKNHVFAVWDFMSLLKRLQKDVAGCDLPWLPPADANLARFVNEVILGEECDEDGQGGYSSHYEL